jgi:hypothetical protein
LCMFLSCIVVQRSPASDEFWVDKNIKKAQIQKPVITYAPAFVEPPLSPTFTGIASSLFNLDRPAKPRVPPTELDFRNSLTNDIHEPACQCEGKKRRSEFVIDVEILDDGVLVDRPQGGRQVKRFSRVKVAKIWHKTNAVCTPSLVHVRKINQLVSNNRNRNCQKVLSKGKWQIAGTIIGGVFDVNPCTKLAKVG